MCAPEHALTQSAPSSQVPLSSNNPELSGLLGQKRHIVVLNKSDLVPSRLHKVL